MSSALSRDARAKHQIASLPIRKDDEIKVKRGIHKGREGKVIAVYRKKWVIHVDKITREKANGVPVQIGIHPSNVEIVKPKIDKNRKTIIERKSKAVVSKDKGKITTTDKNMQEVD